uniref:RING-type domain-containing protein n=2 Tax=Lutzomyia longipalpis TaxID=7200 RepID=A0A1B0CJE3_LUTLO
MGAFLTSETANSVVDPIFGCPVCYEKYKGRILVCLKGHSVCEQCSRQLQKCPQCNAEYRGTRNYSLEDIVVKLKQMNCSPEDAVKRIVEKNSAAVLRETEARGASAPSAPVAPSAPAAAASAASGSSAAASQTNTPLAVEADEDSWLIETISAISLMEPNIERQYRQPVEDFRGSSSRTLDSISRSSCCKMENCRQIILLDELEQHLLSQHRHHVKHLTMEETNGCSGSNFDFNLDCHEHRFALLTDFGIFFLIINIDESSDEANAPVEDAIVTSWIQGVCCNDQAPLFNYTLSIELDGIRATYQDYVHTYKATASHIKWKNQCLGFFVYIPNSSSMKVKGHLCLSDSPTPRRRSSDTIPVPQEDIDLGTHPGLLAPVETEIQWEINFHILQLYTLNGAVIPEPLTRGWMNFVEEGPVEGGRMINYSNEMGAFLTSETANSVVDPIFGCPVCYEKYKGRILVCLKGHSVCEQCSRQLQKCPQCNAEYRGTRNYSLEDIVVKLKQMNCSPEDAVKRIVEKNSAAVLRETEARGASAPSAPVAPSAPAAAASAASGSSAAASQTNTPLAVEADEDSWLIETISAISLMEPNIERQYRQPVEDFRGSSSRTLDSISRSSCCKMENCRQIILLDELEQHLLSQHRHHVKHLTMEETNGCSGSNFDFNLDCHEHRFALLTDFGIFFLIINVDEPNVPDEDTIVTSWIQGVCCNDQAPLFNYTLSIELDGIRATYQDYVHTYKATASHIKWKNQCLGFFVYIPNSSSMKVKGHLSLSDSPTPRRRSSDTIPVPQEDIDLGTHPGLLAPVETEIQWEINFHILQLYTLNGAVIPEPLTRGWMNFVEEGPVEGGRMMHPLGPRSGLWAVTSFEVFTLFTFDRGAFGDFDL